MPFIILPMEQCPFLSGMYCEKKISQDLHEDKALCYLFTLYEPDKRCPLPIVVEEQINRKNVNKVCTCEPDKTSECPIHGYSDLLSKRS